MAFTPPPAVPVTSDPATFPSRSDAWVAWMSVFQAEFLAWTGTMSPIGRNMIINGDMQIDQRNSGGSVSPTSSAYTLDRFVADTNTAGAKYSVQQNAGAVTPPVGFQNYVGITSLSAYAIAAGEYQAFEQLIEGTNFARANWGNASALAISISFWIYSSLTGTFGGCLLNSALNRTRCFTYNIPVANTWTYIKIENIPGDQSGTWLTNSGTGLRVRLGLGCGATYSGTANVWGTTQYFTATGAVSVVGTNAAKWYITGLQVEVGAVSTPFENVDFAISMHKCRRYYQYRIFGAGEICAQLGCTSANNAVGKLFDYDPMRTQPSVTVAGGFVAFNTAASGNTALSALTCSAGQSGLVKVDTATASAGGFWSNVGDVAFIAGGGSTGIVKLDAEL